MRNILGTSNGGVYVLTQLFKIGTKTKKHMFLFIRNILPEPEETLQRDLQHRDPNRKA